MPILSRRNFLLGMLFPSFAASELFALDIKGIDYMPISELARTCGMRYKTISRGKTQTVYSKYSRMVFSVHYVSFCQNSTVDKTCNAQSVHHRLDHKFDTHIHHRHYLVYNMVA